VILIVIVIVIVIESRFAITIRITSFGSTAQTNDLVSKNTVCPFTVSDKTFDFFRDPAHGKRAVQTRLGDDREAICRTFGSLSKDECG